MSDYLTEEGWDRLVKERDRWKVLYEEEREEHELMRKALQAMCNISMCAFCSDRNDALLDEVICLGVQYSELRKKHGTHVD